MSLAVNVLKPRRKGIWEEEEEEEEVYLKPTKELRNFILLVDEASELIKDQLAGILPYNNMYVTWLFFKAIEVLKTWVLQSVYCDRSKGHSYYNCILVRSISSTRLTPENQINVVKNAFALIEFLFRHSPTTINVIKTGFMWFLTQGKINLQYMMQSFIPPKQASLIEQFRVGKGEKQ